MSLSTALQLAAAAAASAVGALPRGACLAAGPYGLLFSLLALYAADVPTTARFTLLRVPMSDKTFTYAAAARLALGAGLRSMLPAAAGMLAGALVATHEDTFARLAVRHSYTFFARFCYSCVRLTRVAQPTRVVLAVLERAAHTLGIAGEAAASAPGGGQRDAAQAQRRGSTDGDGDAAPRRRRAQPAPPPGLRQRASSGAASGGFDATAVGVLTAMGFDEAAATSALHQASGDVALAAELLLAST